MKSLVKPEDSYGDDFARQTFALLVKRLKIDPIVEGRLMEKKVYAILNPKDLRDLQTEDAREVTRLKADKVAETYIQRAKKFWRVYQLYCFNRGQQRATKVLRLWIKGTDKEIKRLTNAQKDLLTGAV